MKKGEAFALWRRSVVLRWLIGYISILLIPLALSCLVYSHSNRVIQQENSRANGAFLTLIQREVDNSLGDMQRLAIQISLNARLRAVIHKDGEPSADEYNQLMKALRVLSASNPAVDNFYIFLRHRNALLSPDTMMWNVVCEQMLERFHLADGTPLQDALWITGKQTLLPVTYRYLGKEANSIALLQPLPLNAGGNPDASLLIVLDQAKLVRTLRDTVWLDEGDVFILDVQNHVLACSKDGFSLPEALRYQRLTEEKTPYTFEAEGRMYSAAHRQSRATDMKYVSLLPLSSLLQEADRARSYTLMAIAFSLALGGGLAALFTRQNYIPIRRLVSKIALEAGTDLMPGQNEFRFLQEMIDSFFDRHHSAVRAKDSQLIHLRRSFVVRILKNDLDQAVSIRDALQFYDLRFTTDTFCVFLFFIRSIEGNVLRDGPRDEYALARYVVRNICEELFNKEHYAVMVTTDDLQALLVNVRDKQDFKKRCRALIDQAEEYLRHNFGVVLSAVASEVTEDGLSDVSRLYAQAYTAMEYNILMGTNGLMESTEVTCGFGGPNHCYFYYYPLREEVQLTNLIKAGDYPAAQAIVSRLLDVNFRRNQPPPLIAKCFMFNLTSTMMKTAYEISNMVGQEPPDLSGRIERLLNCSSYPELAQEMDRMLLLLCGFLSSQSKADQLARRAREYIEAHYADPDLSVAQAAELLGITPAYLSRRFRQQYGAALPEAICKTRIGHAKRLLSETALSLNEVAVSCGFINSNALIRTFKRYEGVTPGKYRELNTRPNGAS